MLADEWLTLIEGVVRNDEERDVLRNRILSALGQFEFVDAFVTLSLADALFDDSAHRTDFAANVLECATRKVARFAESLGEKAAVAARVAAASRDQREASTAMCRDVERMVASANVQLVASEEALANGVAAMAHAAEDRRAAVAAIPERRGKLATLAAKLARARKLVEHVAGMKKSES